MFRVRFKGERFFNGEPQIRQKTIVIDGVPRTFHNHPIFSIQNGDGSYNFSNDEFEPIAHHFEDFEIWEVTEIPDILIIEDESGEKFLECPYCDNGPKTKKLGVLNMHISRFHKDKALNLTVPDIEKSEDSGKEGTDEGNESDAEK